MGAHYGACVNPDGSDTAIHGDMAEMTTYLVHSLAIAISTRSDSLQTHSMAFRMRRRRRAQTTASLRPGASQMWQTCNTASQKPSGGYASKRRRWMRDHTLTGEVGTHTTSTRDEHACTYIVGRTYNGTTRHRCPEIWKLAVFDEGGRGVRIVQRRQENDSKTRTRWDAHEHENTHDKDDTATSACQPMWISLSASATSEGSVSER